MATSSVIQPGQLIPGMLIGDFEVLKLLETGGMAEIYLSRSANLARHAVIKRLKPEFSGDADCWSMFQDEIRLLQSLRHENVVRCLGVEELNGESFLILEYVEGYNLRQIVRQSKIAGKRLPLEVVLTVVAQIAAGLHHAHGAEDDSGRLMGIVHRDVSLSNIAVGLDGRTKLIDFGIVRINQNEPESKNLKGKISYMSPEQVQGKALDCRADIYSLGVVLYEATTGRRLLGKGTPAAIAMKIVQGHFRSPSDFCEDYPKPLEKVVLKALALDPADRFQSAAELRDALFDISWFSNLKLSHSVVANFLRRKPRSKAPARRVEMPLPAQSAVGSEAAAKERRRHPRGSGMVPALRQVPIGRVALLRKSVSPTRSEFVVESSFEAETTFELGNAITTVRS